MDTLNEHAHFDEIEFTLGWNRIHTLNLQEAGVQREIFHKESLVAALVNPCFFQLVLVDVTGLVTLWELSTGRQVSMHSRRVVAAAV